MLGGRRVEDEVWVGGWKGSRFCLAVLRGVLLVMVAAEGW